jgi:hypothetical protein
MRSPTARCKATPLRRLVLHTTAFAMLVTSAGTAMAGACGDSIDGARVPCACGDNLVSDAVLGPDDPVVTEPCSGDGLTIVAPADVDSITLSLGGQSITGRGYGTGVRVARGGRLGAVIAGGDESDGRGEIANFRTGIRASGRDMLREVRSIDVHDNAADGLSIHASGVTLDDVRSERNGRDGVALSGHGNQVSDVTAHGNARDGLKVRGSAATVDAVTKDNGRNGAAIGGRGNHVEQLHTGGNGGAGVMATGSGHRVKDLQATGNGKGSMAGRAGAAE